MLTLAGLEDALSDFLKTEVADKIILKSCSKENEEVFKKPQVIKGYIIPEYENEESDETQFPYICTRIIAINNKNNNELQHIAKIKILFGVYCDGSYKNNKLIKDGSGYRDIWNMIEKTRQALFENRIIAKRYRFLESPFEAFILEEQPYPQWEGWINACFDIGIPEVIRKL